MRETRTSLFCHPEATISLSYMQKRAALGPAVTVDTRAGLAVRRGSADPHVFRLWGQNGRLGFHPVVKSYPLFAEPPQGSANDFQILCNLLKINRLLPAADAVLGVDGDQFAIACRGVGIVQCASEAAPDSLFVRRIA